MRYCYLLTVVLLFASGATHAQLPQTSASAKEAEMLQSPPLPPTFQPVVKLLTDSGSGQTEAIVALPNTHPVAEPPASEARPELSTKKQLRKKATNRNANDPERKTHWANIVAGSGGMAIIISFFLFNLGSFFVALAFFLTIPTAIIGIIGMSKSGNKKPFKGFGWGLFGTIIGFGVFILFMLVIIALAAAFS